MNKRQGGMIIASIVLSFFLSAGIKAERDLSGDSVPEKYKKLFQPAGSKEEIFKIHLDEARYLVAHADVLFVDARSKGEYIQSHIKGAVSIPVGSAEQSIRKLGDKLKGKILVSYCHGVGCHLSDKTAYKLFEAGYRNVLIFFGGWNEWTQANYPVEAFELPEKIKRLLDEAESAAKILKISDEEAKYLYEYNLVNFLDVDSAREYSKKRLYRCISLPYDEFDKKLAAYSNWLSQKPVVVTGRGWFNSRIKKTAKKLYNAGYKKVLIFYDGIDRLDRAGVRMYVRPKQQGRR